MKNDYLHLGLEILLFMLVIYLDFVEMVVNFPCIHAGFIPEIVMVQSKSNGSFLENDSQAFWKSSKLWKYFLETVISVDG